MVEAVVLIVFGLPSLVAGVIFFGKGFGGDV